MRIDKRLNLVVPIYETNDKSPIVAYVHSTPLAEAVVDKWFPVLGKTYNAIWTEGFGFAAGPAHAARILRYVAEKEDAWEDQKGANGIVVGVSNGLMAEIKRLTNLLTAKPDGAWDSIPWDVAIDQGMISDEDRREVENAIVFFIAGYATLNRSQRESVLEHAASLWGARLTSLNSTEFGSSLKTSTGTDNSGKKPPADASDDAGHVRAGGPLKRRSVPV